MAIYNTIGINILINYWSNIIGSLSGVYRYQQNICYLIYYISCIILIIPYIFALLYWFPIILLLPTLILYSLGLSIIIIIYSFPYPSPSYSYLFISPSYLLFILFICTIYPVLFITYCYFICSIIFFSLYLSFF